MLKSCGLWVKHENHTPTGSAVIKEKDVVAGKRLAVVLTGGNVDTDIYQRVLASG